MIAVRSPAGNLLPDAELRFEFGSVSYVPLHESTSPAAIAADQQAAVEWAWYAKGARTPEAVSALTDLPGWVVRRRLHEIGLGPAVPYPTARAAAGKPYRSALAGRVSHRGKK